MERDILGIDLDNLGRNLVVIDRRSNIATLLARLVLSNLLENEVGQVGGLFVALVSGSRLTVPAVLEQIVLVVGHELAIHF